MDIKTVTKDSTSTKYKKMTKHRHKCLYCSKLIQDGEQVIMKTVIKEKYYPVKGLMKFVNYKFYHTRCFGSK